MANVFLASSRPSGAPHGRLPTWLRWLAAAACAMLLLFWLGDGGVPIFNPPRLPDPVGPLGWQVQQTPVLVPLFGVVYGRGQFVAVGDRGAILTSSDGAHWTLGSTRPLNPHLRLEAVTYGAGRYVIVGDAGTILSSEDGLAWTQQSTSFEAGTDGYLSDVTYANGMFMAGGEGILISADGLTWKRPIGSYAEEQGGLAYGDGQFIAVAAGARIDGSADGDHWTPREIASSPGFVLGNGRWQALSGVAYGAGRWVAVGGTGTDGSMFSSTDGVHWTWDRSLHAPGARRVRYADGQFVAVGARNVLTSTDGLAWTSYSTAGMPSLEDVAYGDGRWVGWDGSVTTSN